MAKSLPLVSGIVAAYNYERYLGEALHSALSQDYPPDRLELIVVDDGSTDGTPEIATRYAKESGGRIRYIRQANAGPAAATTRGLQEARGDLITLLDADDVWLTSRTRLLVDALERNPDAGLVYADMEVIDAWGDTLAASWLQEAKQLPYRGHVAAQVLRSNFVMTSSLMVRAELRERFCPIPRWFATQDWPIVARVAEVAEIEFVPAAVALYRRHGANLSNGKHSPQEVAALFRRDIRMRRWMLANVRASHLTVEDLAEAYDYLLRTLGFVARVDGGPPESLVEVSDTDRQQAARELAAGRSELAEAQFVAAASHFLAALAAEPFNRDARRCLDCAQRRLVVPLPPHAHDQPPARSDYHIKSGYSSREAPDCLVDLTDEGDQRDVYARAAEIATQLGVKKIIDLGAGGTGKLAGFQARFEILGLAGQPSLELARRRVPRGIWREHDVNCAEPLPLTSDELDGSVIVCANVIERLVRPEFLLHKLQRVLPFAEAVVLSTTERCLTRGHGDMGPPACGWRAREWSIKEFAALLEEFGFEHGDLGLTRPNTVGRPEGTILAVLYPDAARARELVKTTQARADYRDCE